MAIRNNVDYANIFVGHYNAGDIQYNGHTSMKNQNLIYWKETKNFADGCSSHVIDSYYADGNMALPDQGTFIMERTVFDNGVKLEANHHCNVGTTGVLCMPQYILHDIKWKNRNSGKWIYFQGLSTQGHNSNQNHGGIFCLSPSSVIEVQNAVSSGDIIEDATFPPGYVSLVSAKFTYLLSAPDDVCIKSSSLGGEYDARYNGGILCKVPLRALKIYTRNLDSSSAPRLVADVWFNGNGIVGQVGSADISQQINFHQIGGNGQSSKQGFSMPVIPGTDLSYRLSLTTNDGNIPADWVIEFSDPVIGNRWGVEKIILAIQGRDCGVDGLVSSQHDRTFLWSGESFIDNIAWGNNGACTEALDMEVVDCKSGSTGARGAVEDAGQWSLER
jgi:hypothetical protein